MIQTHRSRYRQRHFVNPSHNLVSHVMEVPADVEVREESAPCFMCGTARQPCKHRKWMDAA